jgi:hypothetical protein
MSGGIQSQLTQLEDMLVLQKEYTTARKQVASELDEQIKGIKSDVKELKETITQALQADKDNNSVRSASGKCYTLDQKEVDPKPLVRVTQQHVRHQFDGRNDLSGEDVCVALFGEGAQSENTYKLRISK